ncbi:hypothetical protein C0995_000831 [Termitomyces sp. Mi166|nr:hypothetical protein C0995_000831 [Termitomyces sp. Mi166\
MPPQAHSHPQMLSLTTFTTILSGQHTDNIHHYSLWPGDITALQNRKQDLVKMWKAIFKTTGDEALLFDPLLALLH